MSEEKNQHLTENEESSPSRSEVSPEGETSEPAESVEIEESANPSEGEPSLEEQLEKARAESKANYDRYLRAVAEMENFRRRAQREKEEARRYGASSLVEDLLPVLDNFGLGLGAADNHPEAKGFAQGFEMVFRQIKSVLKEHGVEEISPDGEPFDPHRHESTGYISHDDIPEGNVVAVSRKGYALNERLIRPAMVLLSSGPASARTGDEEGDGNQDSKSQADAPSEES